MSAAAEWPRTTDEVVVWLLGDGHLSLMDRGGRPLGERASPRYPTCPREERVLRFGDLRDATGLPANVAALRQVAGCLSDSLPAFSGLYASQPADHARFRARAESLCLLAPLLALRTGAAAEESHASCFKLCLGFREMWNETLLRGEVEAAAPVDIDAQLARLGVEPLLVGDAQVCAGSQKQIRAVLTALARTGPMPGDPLWRPLRASWFREAVQAVLALHDLVALCASTALGLFARGVVDDGAAIAALAQSPRGPRISEALRTRTDGAPLRVSLLYREPALPSAVTSMIEHLAHWLDRPAPALTQLDAMLLEHGAPLADRLMAALGRSDGGTLGLDAFRALAMRAHTD